MATDLPAPHKGEFRHDLNGTPDAAEFKGRTARGAAATIFAQALGMFLQVGTAVVLARLLSPADYGLQAMVFSLTTFVNLFKDAGLSVATIQREAPTREQISTLFWINVGLGVSLMLLVVALAPVLAAFYREPKLLPITLASATVFLFSGLTVQHRALLDRAMRFTTGVKIDILSAVIGTVIAIVMAAVGCGYWALICQNISLPIVSAIGVWLAMPWLPGRPRWSPELRSMVHFGGIVTLNSAVVYLAYNAEKVLLGRFWGAAPLGLYSRAYQLVTLPMQQLMAAVGAVALPMLSRMQADVVRLRRSFTRFHSVVVSITLPVVICCTLFADEIIHILLGPKWAGAARVLRLFSPTVLVWALINPLSWLLRAKGFVVRSLQIALFIAPVVILGVLLGLRHGPAGVALGYSSAMVLLAVPLVAWAKYGTGISTGDYWDAIRRPLLSAALGGVCGLAFKLAFEHTLTPFALLVLGATLSFAVYACFLLFAMGQKDFYVDLVRHVVAPKLSVATNP